MIRTNETHIIEEMYRPICLFYFFLERSSS
nr:MAG TPA: hypothetical protein [Caudoviricetes sp.]